MKKILIMHPELVVGGAEKVLLDMLRRLDHQKYDITLLLRNPAIWDDQIPPCINVKYMFKNNPRTSGRLISKLYKYSLIAFPTVLYKLFGAGSTYNIAIAYHEPMIWFLPALKAYTISWIHTDYSALQWFPEVKELSNKNGLIAKWIVRRRLDTIRTLNKVVFVAKSAIKGYIEKTGYNISNTAVCYNLNNEVDIISKANEPITDELWSKYKGNHLVVVGRIHSQKAMHRLIPLMHHINEARLDAKIYIVGDGPDRNMLEKLIHDNNLDSDIIILGFSNNPFKYVSQSKLLICTSVFEAYCTATKESIILETPFVTTLCSGMEEQVDGTKAGLIAPNENDSIASYVIKVLKDEELYRQMKKDIRERHKALSDENALCAIQNLLDSVNKKAI